MPCRPWPSRSCRRCVLDDRDGTHVVGVEAVQVALDSVDQHERVGGVDRRYTADVDCRRAAGLTARSGDVQTGYGTLQHVAQGVGDAVFEFLAAYGCDSAREVDLFLCAVTDDDRFVEHNGVFLQVDGDVVFGRGDRYLLGKVAQGGYGQDNLLGRNLNGETAVFGGCDAFGRTIDQDGYSNKRLLIGIENFPGYHSVLGRQG